MATLTIQDLVREFAFKPADEKLLAGVIAGTNKDTYEAVGRAELARWGQPAPFSLRDKGIARDMNKAARASAKSIRRTHNTDLRAAARNLRAANPTQTKAQLSQSLQQWFTKRQEWKGKQIAITEAYRTQQRATLDFYQRSGLTEARFNFGGSLKCPICAAIATGNPHTLDDARATPTPVHVNCGDAWTADLPDDTAPKWGTLWTGAGK
jgi:hypothetical protein